MKQLNWLALALAGGLALSGCTSMHTGSNSDQTASGSSTGTMRRAEADTNASSTSPAARDPNCVPSDERQNCPPDSEGSRTNSMSRSSESATDVQTPESGAPVPR